MTAPGSPTLTPSAASHFCAPDPYLTEARLARIFDEFNSEISRSTPSSTIFTHLVNHIRATYISQILQQQHQPAPDGSCDLQLAAQGQRHLNELAAQRKDLDAQYESKLSALVKLHTRQLAAQREVLDVQYERNLSELVEARTRQLAAQDQRQQAEVAMERAELATQYDRKLCELVETHIRQLAAQDERHQIALAAQRADLDTQYERKLCELVETHTRQLAAARPVLEVAPREWLSDIEVVYDNEGQHSSSDHMNELYGESNDINAGYNGRCVWLVPKYSTTSTRAITDIKIDMKFQSDGRRDLAGGAPGSYRLLSVERVNTSRKIFAVNLLRLKQDMTAQPAGYDGCTGNINAGRGGDFVYIIWKSLAI